MVRQFSLRKQSFFVRLYVQKEHSPNLRVTTKCLRLLSAISISSGCWTNWFDRDNPSGTGDWETLNDFYKEGYNLCFQPQDVRCRTKNTRRTAYRYQSDKFTLCPIDKPYNSTGESVTCTLATGLICKNQDQTSGKRCSDYEVSFLCPCNFNLVATRIYLIVRFKFQVAGRDGSTQMILLQQETGSSSETILTFAVSQVKYDAGKQTLVHSLRQTRFFDYTAFCDFRPRCSFDR